MTLAVVCGILARLVFFKKALILNNDDAYKKLADRYFDVLAQRFPVMCASDEFDFVPRAQNAAKYYHRLGQLEADAIEETILGRTPDRRRTCRPIAP